MEDIDFLPQELILGKRYVVNWSKRSAGFRLESIEDDMVLMYDPFKKRNFKTAKDSLRLKNCQAYKNARKRNEN